MNQLQLYKSVFNTYKDLGDSIADLENVTSTYPYFGLAQYFLLKSKIDANINSEKQASCANLFFNNPFLLHHRLNEINNTKVQNDNGSNTNPIIEWEKSENATIINTEAIPPSKIEKEPLLFEPLYTTDYFASQGIKLSEKVLDNDKLGQQLKSFTSWLKTMKKVHPEKIATNNATNEAAIQALAEKSNVEEEVYTEAMAEAFVQQGKPIRATEVYLKLSLMFPEKSAYFAAKIDNLK
jgi:hypothetical protein